ncbi:MAG: FemAB family XrtA/PEP-CTERM system-associated protein, partial [Candidatus Binatia bacterium]
MIRPCDDPAAWDAYVEAHPGATQYHRHAWLGVIQRSFGHRPLALAAYSGERITGVFPMVFMSSFLFGRFAVSLPFVNYGGLLANGPDVERALWSEAVARARAGGSRYLEARHLARRDFVPHRREHKVTMILELAPDADRQWKAFDAKLRNQIRKAERSGLTCRIGDARDLPAFYDVFACCMRDLGTPVYGSRFFSEVLTTFGDSSRLFLVEAKEQIVAGGIGLVHGDRLEVPWAASLREYRAMCPNNLLYWDLIRHAIGMGLRRFDFGRSTPGDGPYRFKEQWGARPVPLSWEYWLGESQPLPDLSPKNRKYQARIELWKRLPVAVTRWLGP